MKTGDIIELNIDSLAFGSSGIGRFIVDEKPFTIFVEGTVPGDIVKVRIGRKKKKYAFGYIEEFIKKSSQRMEPRCKHFGACGGCALQFLSYEEQLKIKEQHVKDAVARIGGLDAGIVLPIIGCKEPWYYRNKMEFSFGQSKDGCLELGLHLRRMHYDVIELEECLLLNDYVGDLIKVVRDFFRNLPKEKSSNAINLKSLVVREGKNSGEIMINLITENLEESFSGAAAAVENFLESFKNMILIFFEKIKISSIYFTNVKNKKGQPKQIVGKLLWGNPTINEIIKLNNGVELAFQISPQAFFQPNTRQAEVLYSQAIAAADLTGNETVFDLFCGTGTIGIFAAGSAKKVYGIEINASAVEDAKKNAELNRTKNIEFVIGDVLKNLPQLKEQPDVIIVDPPRNGLMPETIEKIAEFGPQKIVYVSCNPATLARDGAMFKKTGYTLLQVQPVDMFPQTYHIECVALFKPFSWKKTLLRQPCVGLMQQVKRKIK